MAYRLWMTGNNNAFVEYYFPSLQVNFALDATFMWLTYIAYIAFWGRAFMLHEAKGMLIHGFYRSAIPVLAGYIIWENIAVNIEAPFVEICLYIGVRLFVCCFGVIAMISVLQKRRSFYYYYLAGGTIAMVSAGLFSTYVQQVLHSRLLDISPFGWMMFGYFIDVIFFSAAIGYRLKEESVERMTALKKIISQQEIIQRQEIEKIEAAYRAKEQERARISGELHDDLGGGLSTIRLMTEMARDATFGLNGAYLEKISARTKELMQNMNEIIWSLNNSNDTLQSMISYIRQYAANIRESTGWEMMFEQSGIAYDHIVTGTVRRHIFLLVKEALNNVLKHAHATKLAMRISHEEHGISISISDNGVGMLLPDPVDTMKRQGNGLNNMRERIKALNGAMHILHKNGTTVVFHIPSGSLYNKSGIEIP